jgi:PAS domain S-box-containing protein
MTSAPLPADEPARLEALRRYAILDTPPEADFDDLTRLASQICGTPIALISLVDARRQWFKSRVGLAAVETLREEAFCAHTILGPDLMEVTDARQDERFRDNPLVTGAPGIRFYAGMPLATAGGHRVGTLCVIDRAPRQLDAAQREALALLGRQVVLQFEMRLANRRLQEQTAFQQAILDSAAASIISTAPDGVITTFSRGAQALLGYNPEELVGRATPEVIHDAGEVAVRAAELSRELGREIAPGFEVFVAHARAGQPETREWTYLRKDGTRVPVLLSVSAIRSGDGTLTGFLGVARDISRRKRAELRLQEERDLAAGLSVAQARFIVDEEPRAAFDGLLALLLKVTGSEYGFIGEILRGADGAPYLKTHAITNIAWNDETREFYAHHAPKGLEFRNLKTLFGAVISSGRPVIANQPAEDPRRGGLPPGHPAMHAFLGLPFKAGEELVGMVGVANRPGGYDDGISQNLEPFLAACAGMVSAYRAERRRREAEAALRESELRQKLALEGADLGAWDWNVATGVVAFNARWAGMLGYQLNEIEPHLRAWEKLVHPEDLPEVTRRLTEHLENRAPAYEAEHRMRHKDGRWVWVLDKGRVIDRDAGGRPLRACGTHLDITARREADAERERLIGELRAALDEVRTLTGLLPICAWCKKVRNDSGYWEEVEGFFKRRGQIDFTHGICPACADRFRQQGRSGQGTPPGV